MELILVAVSIGIILLYHVFYWYRIKNDPAHTVFGLGKMVRLTWVEKILSDPKHFLLAVQVVSHAWYPLQDFLMTILYWVSWSAPWLFLWQTMRNEILAGQFLAQASFIALSVIVGAASSGDLPAKLKASAPHIKLSQILDPLRNPTNFLAVLFFIG
jgi:hypothetical protein